MFHVCNYTSKVSIPLPDDETVRSVIGPSYSPEKTLNVLKMFAGTVDMYDATIGLVKAVFNTAGIDPRAREMIILRSAKILNCPYEWQANERFAKNVGLSTDEIRAALAEGPVTGVDSRYVLLCKATDELSLTGTFTDETLSELLEEYGATTSRKFALMISWFNLLSRFLNACRVPLETTDKLGDSTSPL